MPVYTVEVESLFQRVFTVDAETEQAARDQACDEAAPHIRLGVDATILTAEPEGNENE